MKIMRPQFIVITLLIGLFGCMGVKAVRHAVYVGNFLERDYKFFESVKHTNDPDYFHTLPFELKFGGIRPFPYDSTGTKEYAWLRDPTNLMMAFNAFKLVGLDKFVSVGQYNEKKSTWCCDAQWMDKSLNEIVQGFLLSDTISDGEEYYYEFWERRRIENNLTETWQIFQQIDGFYNNRNLTDQSLYSMDTTLHDLLSSDRKLASADSLSYPRVVIEYFNYLKKIKLEYSAYKLVFHNSRLTLPIGLQDSLLSTLKYDTNVGDFVISAIGQRHSKMNVSRAFIQ
jgi:hypothetical protein